METIPMTLEPNNAHFRAEPRGPEFVYLDPWPPEDGQILYRRSPRRSQEGPYVALPCWGLGGHAFDLDHELWIGNPHDRWIEQLARKDTGLRFNGMTFDQVEHSQPWEVGVVPLPPEVRADDVFLLPDQRLIHLSGDPSSNELWVDSLRASIGRSGEVMRPIHVSNVRHCCYGAWFVETELGTLRVFQWFGDQSSRWGPAEVKRLKPEHWTAKSGPDGMRIELVGVDERERAVW